MTVSIGLMSPGDHAILPDACFSASQVSFAGLCSAAAEHYCKSTVILCSCGAKAGKAVLDLRINMCTAGKNA